MASRSWMRRPLKWKKLAETAPHARNATSYHLQPVVQSFGAGNAQPEWRQSAQGSQVRVRYKPDGRDIWRPVESARHPRHHFHAPKAFSRAPDQVDRKSTRL